MSKTKTVSAIAFTADRIVAVTEHQTTAEANAAAAMAIAVGLQARVTPVWHESVVELDAGIAAARASVQAAIDQDKRLAAAAAVSPNYSES